MHYLEMPPSLIQDVFVDVSLATAPTVTDGTFDIGVKGKFVTTQMMVQDLLQPPIAEEFTDGVFDALSSDFDVVA